MSTPFEETDLLNDEQKIEFVRQMGEALKGHPCDHDHTHAVGTLACMGFTVEQMCEILDFCRDHGGYCDCEIILNVICGEP